MVSKKLFIGMLVVATGASLWLGGNFFYHLNHYFQLSQSAPAIISGWEVIEVKSGRFSPQASYKFHFGEREISGTFLFPKPIYSNPYLARDFIDSWEGKNWMIWFSPKHLYEPSLQKMFPMKEGIHFAISLGIILYFAFLNLYVKRMHVSEEENEKALS